MTPVEKPRRIYSLQRRLQLLAATSLVVAVFILITGTWSLNHVLNHDLEYEATTNVTVLLEVLGRESTSFDVGSDPRAQLDEMQRRNPDAWYYYEDTGKVLSSSPDAPRYKQGLTGETAQLFIDGESSSACSQAASRFLLDRPEGQVLVRAGGCGSDAYYMEIAGFKVGESFVAHIWDQMKTEYLSEASFKENVVPVLVIALITIGAITLLFGTLMKRVEAVSGTASQIGKGKHHVRLPEDNLPKEVLPMVQAINRAISRLEAASEQQALFVAAAAHELRTPLTVFRTRLEQMEESELKDELIGDMQRVDSMVTQLLALAKLGASELDLEKLDLVDVVRATCQERGGAVFVAGKELSFDVSEKTAHVLGDRESVKTAVANLIDNALMFTPEGKSVSVLVDGNRVTVTDEGPGVAPESKERIFEPFYKNPPNKAGHGLGLAIVSEIKRIHDGAVATRSSDAGGAVFELTFKDAA